MEQSPLSHSIRNLEGELRTQLFHRTTRRTWLTEAGERFYREAQRVLSAVEHAKASVVHAQANQNPTLRVGLAEHAAGELFATFMFDLEHRAPPVRVDLQEVPPNEAARFVRSGDIDVALVHQPVDEPGLRCTRAWVEPLSIVAPFGHRLAARDSVSTRDLTDETIIMPHPRVFPGCGAQIQALLDRNDVRPRRIELAENQYTMLSLVAAERGTSIITTSLAEGFTTVAVIPISDAGAHVVSYFLSTDVPEASAVAAALNAAREIDRRSSGSTQG